MVLVPSQTSYGVSDWSKLFIYIFAMFLHSKSKSLRRIFSAITDPLGIVVYSDLPDGACFNRTLATRDSARSCPTTSSSSKVNVTAKTLQNKPKNMASRPRLNRPTTLRPSRPSPAETLIYETVDKPAQVGIFFPKNLRNFREMEGIFHVKRNRSLKTFPNRPPKICIQSKTKVKSAALQPFSLPKVFNPILL